MGAGLSVRPSAIRNVGLIGCGRMGSQIARHLLRAGWSVMVTDIDTRAVDALAADGASSAETARDVATASDLTLVVVVDDQQVRDVLTGEEGVFERGPATGVSIVAVCASVKPQTCREVAGQGADRGIEVVDVALARGESGAERGELLLFCGGRADVIDACRPAFSAFATDVVHVGPVGTGQVAKMANNVLLWACLRADVETMRLARALGVEPTLLRSAVQLGSGANQPLEDWGQHRLRWPAKDLALALELAEEAGIEMPFVRKLAPLMAELTVEDIRDLR